MDAADEDAPETGGVVGEAGLDIIALFKMIHTTIIFPWSSLTGQSRAHKERLGYPIYSRNFS